ncbi:hypothetical protein HQ865_14075 [Mucilaginibacter mali]|uniref:Uncharacterized protein n=1 Tax=Mucilaginibacter mali TaxID=2740462 RepID=A0A7D4PUL7_9SPHI|nr:hypothetical protein [Mucilaginibacter mali]QKJ30828.1 hypothetical protein HQ865_14075 [Mucilaginibacter mali]
MTWNIAVIIIGLLMAAFAAWREYQRVNKAHIFWRMIAAIVAPISLVCVVLPLSYSTTVTSSAGAGKILLTDGFNTDSLSKNDRVFTLDKTIHQQYPKAKLLDDVQDLFADSAHISPVHIYGHGLSTDELKQLSGRPVIFHPSTISDGFTSVSWTDHVKTGQQFRVQGAYKNTSTKTFDLVLKGLNTTLDSIRVSAGSQPPFALKTTPKNAGRAVYSLIALNGKDTLQQENMPVIINKAQPLKVLMLSSSPDFETKFLKDWLGANGYSVASRSAITKGKTGQEFINTEQADLSHINTTLLSKFDVVVGDLSSFKKLSVSENSALHEQVSQKGLGLIVRADSSDKKTTWLQDGFALNYQAGKQAALSTVTIQGAGKTAKLNIDPIDIAPQNNMQALVSDERGHTLSGITINGAGKVLFTTINNTYSWMLSGNKSDYTALWSLLIDKAARRVPATENWSVAQGIAGVNEPVQLISESGSIAGAAKINGLVAYPARDAGILFKQTFTYWPANYGWQQVTGYNDSSFWWYAWKDSEWKTMAAANKTMLTAKYAKANPVESIVTKQIRQKTNAAVPKIYFYILFLVAATFLWAESKFFS